MPGSLGPRALASAQQSAQPAASPRRAPAGPHVGVGRQVQALALALAVLPRGCGARGAGAHRVPHQIEGQATTPTHTTLLGFQETLPPTPACSRTLRHAAGRVRVHILLAHPRLLRHVLEHARRHLHACGAGKGVWQGGGRSSAQQGAGRWREASCGLAAPLAGRQAAQPRACGVVHVGASGRLDLIQHRLGQLALQAGGKRRWQAGRLGRWGSSSCAHRPPTCHAASPPSPGPPGA